MERINLDIWLKGVFLFGGSFVSFLNGTFGLLFTVLLGLMLIDFITGIMAAISSGEGLKSAKGYRGIFKKIYTMLLIGAIFMVEISVLKTNGILTDGISSAFIFMELVSIIENGSKMGLPLGFLNKFVAQVKAKVPVLSEESKKEENEKTV